jgi:hypothetical protein
VLSVAKEWSTAPCSSIRIHHLKSITSPEYDIELTAHVHGKLIAETSWLSRTSWLFTSKSSISTKPESNH